MKSDKKDWDVDRIARLKKKINPKPQYQRTLVWSISKQQLLIDSMLRGYDLPKFYLRTAKSSSKYDYEIVDGQQRLTAIWQFCENKFPLGEESETLPLGDLSGKHHDELSKDLREQLGFFEMTFVIIESASDEEVRDLFKRLQEGVPLNPAEKRNAISGNMRNFCAKLASSHRVFPLTSIKNKRFAWDDLAALVTCLEISGEPCDIKAPSLREMYESKKKFGQMSKKAKKIIRTLNYMEKVLAASPPEMDIKWGFVDLYFLLSTLLDGYDINSKEAEICSFFVGLETDRRSDVEIEDLVRSADPLQNDLAEYIGAFVTSGATKKNVRTRSRIYLSRLLHDIPDLVPKDPKRDFTREERLVIWRRDDGKCQSCGVNLDFDDMHADHIIAHSKGGVTSIENGQALCAPCNLRKGAKKEKRKKKKKKKKKKG